ncbi:MAG: carbamoyltransferase C-terminal domain-containing protein [Candidatus Erginobacter occultus]|nr:carbamoyltransferase C-terminal domain-containing protein [Candidatus Erginobacter occultus]
MNILGINAYHPDASIALLRDGVPVWAAEEERFNRIKHISGFPEGALRRCLEDLEIGPAEIDVVAISKNPWANLGRKVLFVLRHRPDWSLVSDRLGAFRRSSSFSRDFTAALGVSPAALSARFVNVEHHRAHIASSFFLSGFERAAFLSIDGMGDFSSAVWGRGEANRLDIAGRVYFPHSAGFLYTAATQFLGFMRFGDEYKVMGLAAYGKPVFLNEFRKMFSLRPGGGFRLNLDYFTHHRGQAKVRWQGGSPEQDIMFSGRWTGIFGPPRAPDAELTDRDRDLAASLQAALEEILFHTLNCLHRNTGEENLALAGGVAFNSLANGKITARTPFKNVYIQPAAGDSGTALGAAAFVYHCLEGKPRSFTMDHAYLGPGFNEEQLEAALSAAGLPFRKLEEEELFRRTAEAVSRGLVVGWFQGRMEYGPRALGNRSILADPRRKDMKDILNHRVKSRESFRPFAPSVLEEKAGEYFKMDCPSSPYMLKVFPVREEKRDLIPAITHRDGTARVQTVSRKTNPRYWKVIDAFGKLTGIPMVLNTSFNENEPIVCTPEEAVNCYLKTRIDVLVLGRYFLRKEGEKGR